MFNRIKKSVYGLVAGGSVAIASTPAFAALDLTGVTFDLANYEAVAALILTAFAAIWGIKRVMGLVVR